MAHFNFVISQNAKWGACRFLHWLPPDAGTGKYSFTKKHCSHAIWNHTVLPAICQRWHSRKGRVRNIWTELWTEMHFANWSCRSDDVTVTSLGRVVAVTTSRLGGDKLTPRSLHTKMKQTVSWTGVHELCDLVRCVCNQSVPGTCRSGWSVRMTNKHLGRFV